METNNSILHSERNIIIFTPLSSLIVSMEVPHKWPFVCGARNVERVSMEYIFKQRGSVLILAIMIIDFSGIRKLNFMVTTLVHFSWTMLASIQEEFTLFTAHNYISKDNTR